MLATNFTGRGNYRLCADLGCFTTNQIPFLGHSILASFSWLVHYELDTSCNQGEKIRKAINTRKKKDGPNATFLKA
jgi:hypothetical protein